MAHPKILAEKPSAVDMHPGKKAALSIGLLALAAEQGVTLIERKHHDKLPHFIKHEGIGDTTVFTIPGCRSNGSNIAQMMGPYLSSFGRSISTVYPENGFSLKTIGDGLLAQKKEANNLHSAVYAISMGGLVLAELVRSEGFMNRFGPIDALILDSSPASIDDIRPLHRALIEAASIARFSSLGTKLAREVITHSQIQKPIEHEPGIDDNLVYLHHVSSANTPLHIVGSQHDFMYSSHIPAKSLRGVANDIYYVQSPYDSVINTDKAYKNYCAMFDCDIRRIVDHSRPYGSHAAGPEFPSQIVELLKPRVRLVAA